MTGPGHSDHKSAAGGSTAVIGERRTARCFPGANVPYQASRPPAGSKSKETVHHLATSSSEGSVKVVPPSIIPGTQTTHQAPGGESSKSQEKIEGPAGRTGSVPGIHSTIPAATPANSKTAGFTDAISQVATHSPHPPSAVPAKSHTVSKLPALENLTLEQTTQRRSVGPHNTGGKKPESTKRLRQQLTAASVAHNLPTDVTHERHLMRRSPAWGDQATAGASSLPPGQPAAVVSQASTSQSAAAGSDASAVLGARPEPGESADPSRGLAAGHVGPASHAAAPVEPFFAKMLLGIESEFLLEALNEQHQSDKLKPFVTILAKNHNEEVNSQHPRMQCSLLTRHYPNEYKEWSMVIEPTIMTREAPWGVEMVSPILEVCPGGPWREHVTATWKYLQQYYRISSNFNCSTHIHISRSPCYSLQDLKGIASSVIHFEPAFEALVPPHRTNNMYARSNWLDSSNLARKGRSRAASIAAIEAVVHWPDVMRLMAKRGDRNFSWNFEGLNDKGTIEFRKPPASVTPDEALSWAELTLNFVQAAMKYGCAERLRKIPATIKGLHWFLRQVQVPGVNEPDRWQKIWAGKEEDAAKQPEPIFGLEMNSLEIMQKLKPKIEADMERVRTDAKSLQAPYWQ